MGIGDGYGQTETGPVTGMRPGEDDPARDGSMGRPLPGIEARVLDGELQLRPDTVPTFFSHYLGEPRSRASGGRPATTSARTRTATSGSRAVTTTSSSPPATGSARSRSSPRWSPTRPSPRPRPSRRPTTSAARWSARSSCWRTASPLSSSPASSRSTCKRSHRPLQVPAHRRVRRRAAEDAERQDPARRARDDMRRLRETGYSSASPTEHLSPASPGSSSSPTSGCWRSARRSPSSPTTSRTTSTARTSRSGSSAAPSPSPASSAARSRATSPTAAGASRR